ncbi:hypothetical protein FJ250_08125 [bacterium]|nr:hypothetical protein [bacterium]
MRRWLLLLVLAVAGGPARAADDGGPATVLALARLDSVAVAVPGRLAGVAWLGPDTLAVLVVAPEADGASPVTRLVLQDRRGHVLRSEDVTGVADRGLAWDGACLWAAGDADGGVSRLLRLDPARLTVVASYPTAGHRPAAVCHDGRFVWLVDRDSGRLERFDPSLLEITRSTAAPAFSPAGLAWDGRHLWLTDAGTGRLYRLSGSRRAWSGTVAAADFGYRGRAVHLTHDGRDLWFAPEDGRWLVRARIS